MKMIVRYSSIIIEDYNLGDCEKLEKYFTLYDKVRHKTYLFGVHYDEDRKELRLPRGLDVRFLEDILNIKANIESKANYYISNLFPETKIKFAPRDDNQIEALSFMLGTGQYSKYRYSTAQLVNLPQGKGKTYCGIVSSVIKGDRTMVITSSLEWLKQWKKNIVDYCSDITNRNIYFMSGSESIHRLYKMKDLNQYKFFLASDATLKSYGDRYGWDKVEDLFKYLQIGIKIYDECHLHFDNMCMIDFYSNVNKTYYLSATPLRGKEDENRIFQLYFKNIPILELFDPESDPHTHYISIKFHSKPSISEQSECASAKYGLDRNKYISYIVDKPNFHKILKMIIRYIKEEKTLIYIGKNEEILKVKDLIETYFPEYIGNIGIFTTMTNSNDRKKELDKQIILSTTKSAGTAVDIKGLKNTVVLAEPFKSEVLARQSLGRTRDDNTKYIEVVDMSFPQITRYFYHKLPIFKVYAKSVSSIDLRKDKIDKIE